MQFALVPILAIRWRYGANSKKFPTPGIPGSNENLKHYKSWNFVNLLSLAPASWPPTWARHYHLTPPVCPPLWPHLSLPPCPAKHVLTFSTMGFERACWKLYSSHILQRRIGPHYRPSLSAGTEKVLESRMCFPECMSVWYFPIWKSKSIRPWQDSNLQSPDPKSGALSIRPHELTMSVLVTSQTETVLRINTCCNWIQVSFT